MHPSPRNFPPAPAAPAARRGLVSLVAGVALAASPCVATAADGAPGGLGRWRFETPVLVEGEQIPSLGGTPIASLSVLASDGAALVPIPFQVDERDPEGAWVLDVVRTEGIAPAADVDGQALDDNDELVFMASDAGPRAPTPPGAIELALVDPLSGAEAFVYVQVAAEGTTPVRSDDRYVSLTAATDSIEARGYGLTFAHAPPLSWAFFALKDEAGRTGPNLVDRIKIRIKATVLADLVDVHLTEDDLASTVVGYRAGPVRVIRRVDSHYYPAGLDVVPVSFSMSTLHYRNTLHFPSELYTPLELGFLLSDLEVDTYIDFRSLEGWRFRAARVPEFVSIDGEMSEAEQAMELADSEWLAGHHDGIGFVSRLWVGPTLETMDRDVHYVDDASLDDAPESQAGVAPAVGFRFDNFVRTAVGWHEMDIELHVIRPFAPGDEVDFLGAIDAPLSVEVRGAAAPSAAAPPAPAAEPAP